jgi:hypothetical protein
MYPPNPNMLLRMFDGGKSSVIAALVFGFGLGYVMGKGDKEGAEEYWKDKARRNDHHWNHEGYHTHREHDRESHRHHKHEDGYGR